MVFTSFVNSIRSRWRNRSSLKRPNLSSSDDDDGDDDLLIDDRSTLAAKRARLQIESTPMNNRDNETVVSQSPPKRWLSGLATWVSNKVPSFVDLYYFNRQTEEQASATDADRLDENAWQTARANTYFQLGSTVTVSTTATAALPAPPCSVKWTTRKMPTTGATGKPLRVRKLDGKRPTDTFVTPLPQQQQTVINNKVKGTTATTSKSPDHSSRKPHRSTKNDKPRQPSSSDASVASVFDRIFNRSEPTQIQWNTCAYDNIRLAERDRYQAFLQQHTSMPLGPPTSASIDAARSDRRQAPIRQQKLDDNYGNELRGRLTTKPRPTLRASSSSTMVTRSSRSTLNSTSSPKILWSNISRPEVEFVQVLSDDVVTPALNLTRRSGQSEQFVPTIELSDEDDDDVVAIPLEDTDDPLTSKIKSSELKSLSVDISRSPYLDALWLANLQSQYDSKDESQRRQIAAYEDKVKKYERSQCAKLERRIEESLRLDEIQIEDDEEEEVAVVEALPALSEKMLERIEQALVPKPPNEVLSEGFSLSICRRDMDTLAGINWLNDEVINFYFNLLMERGKLDNFPSLHACNTFFYPKLISGGHAALKRWTRKVDIFAHEMMLVPVHLGVHWCLAVVDFTNKKISYYDSMGGKNDNCLKALLEYLKAEHKDKKGSSMDTSDWTTENEKDNPHQLNGSDCGMFTCKYAEYISRRAKITFTQMDMPYFRNRMVYELLTKQLM